MIEQISLIYVKDVNSDAVRSVPSGFQREDEIVIDKDAYDKIRRDQALKAIEQTNHKTIQRRAAVEALWPDKSAALLWEAFDLWLI